ASRANMGCGQRFCGFHSVKPTTAALRLAMVSPCCLSPPTGAASPKESTTTDRPDSTALAVCWVLRTGGGTTILLPERAIALRPGAQPHAGSHPSQSLAQGSFPAQWGERANGPQVQ